MGKRNSVVANINSQKTFSFYDSLRGCKKNKRSGYYASRYYYLRQSLPGFSIAGERRGLSGERSGLFMEAIRVIRQMRQATRGKQPRFAVWENVFGTFSSTNGNDFKTVLEEIAETEIPIPKSRKWARAGMVGGNGFSIAWRTLDAQYWGVPQRRERIFLVADFGGQCAGKILFKPESMSWHIKKGKKTWKGIAGNIEAGAGNASACIGYREELSPTLKACENETNQVPAIIHPVIAGTLCASAAGLNRPAGQGNEIDLIVAYNITFCDSGGRRSDRPDGGLYVNKTDKANTVTAKLSGYETAIVYNKYRFSEYREGIGTLRANTSVTEAPLCVATGQANATILKDLCSTLNCNGEQPYIVGNKYIVRRLTPLECERLMDFPDNWTSGLSDTQRYKTIGNSVAIPCAEYIMEGIAQVLRINMN